MAIIRHEDISPDKFNANQCKNAVLSYFRFTRGFPYVATEFQECDVVVANEKEWIDIEVKVSWSDYRAEWKKSKHTKYEEGGTINGWFNCNRRFFAAPPKLAAKILEDINESHPKYGVISIFSATDVEILKRAEPRHKEATPEKILTGLVARMSSELITLRRMLRA